MFAIQCLV